MVSTISKLKLIVMSEDTRQPLSNAEVYWDKMPEGIKNSNVYFQKYKNSENGLQIDVSNRAGFSLLWGELVLKKQLWFYIHKIVCPGFKEKRIERKLYVKSNFERELIVYLTADNERSK